jgi:hypothetical protein
MEPTMKKDNSATIPDDLESIPEVAKKINRPYSSVYNRARRGDITVHFISGDTQAKISLSETRSAFNARRRFSASTFRIVRHDEESAGADKVDLFS